jgi:hypothetical protein
MTSLVSSREAVTVMISSELADLIEEHARRLEEDIKLARTRDEHLRVTARANEARQIANGVAEVKNPA